MNIYLMNEDSENFCIQAETMHQAIKIGEALYLKECDEENPQGYNEKEEIRYYHEEILQSCSFIGELRNVCHQN